MPYTRTTWQDYPNTTTAITAARLNNIESFLDSFGSITDPWTSYTPTLAQGASTDIAKTVTYAKYRKIGRLVILQINVTATASGPGSANITLSLPVTAATSGYQVGNGYYLRVNVSGQHCPAWLVSTSTVALLGSTTGNMTYVGSNPNIAVANNHQMQVSIMYESAS